MNREIKFRAIINPTTTIYFDLYDLVAPDPKFSIREFLIPWLQSGNKPDEYTGLKDSKGKEIYEGDIVETYVDQMLEGKDVVGEIVIKPDCTYIDFPQYGSAMWIGYFEDQDIKVIGNIYENPELLEETND